MSQSKKISVCLSNKKSLIKLWWGETEQIILSQKSQSFEAKAVTLLSEGEKGGATIVLSTKGAAGVPLRHEPEPLCRHVAQGDAHFNMVPSSLCLDLFLM